MIRKWTEEEEKILRDLHAKNISVDKMVKILQDRTQHAVRSKLDMLGLGPPKHEPQIDYDLYHELMNAEEV